LGWNEDFKARCLGSPAPGLLSIEEGLIDHCPPQPIQRFIGRRKLYFLALTPELKALVTQTFVTQ
jgi:hypothetical protein